MMPQITPAAPAQAPQMTIVDMVREAARKAPEAEAVVCGDTRRTWALFDARVNRLANALIARGISRGDRVAALAPNSAEYAELFMATLRAGACMVPLSTMASAEALEKMIRDSGAKVLFLAQAYRDLVAPFEGALVLGARVAFDFDADRWEGYETFLAEGEARDPMVPVGMEDAFNIIYSSGTTGTPKGILHNHHLRAVQQTTAFDNGYGDNARCLLSTPLYSNTTIVAFLPTLTQGGCVHLMAKFDARAYLEIVERERITHTMLVPVQYKRIMDVPDFDRFDLGSMRLKNSTSAPLRADVKVDVLARFPGRLVEYYGLTEGGGTTVLDATATPDKLHTVGQPAPGCTLKFIDDEGHELPAGEVGEIVGRATTMMSGYFGRDDLTAEYLWHDAEGLAYFRSGDMGRLDADGYLILSDRKKDMIISGGLNIYADDLERALLAIDGVRDAAVIGVPSDAWGETPLGLVVLDDGIAEGDVLAAANAQLGKSQRLSAVEARAELPRSAIGKILKRELRAPYWDACA